jgi:hypothetical protein
MKIGPPCPLKICSEIFEIFMTPQFFIQKGYPHNFWSCPCMVYFLPLVSAHRLVIFELVVSAAVVAKKKEQTNFDNQAKQ